MNSLLFLPGEVGENSEFSISDERYKEIIDKHDLRIGAIIPYSILHGIRGKVEVILLDEEKISFKIVEKYPPILREPTHLVVAISRPQIMKRIFLNATLLGVESINFVKTDLSEKNYLSSKELQPQQYMEQIYLALQQGCDSIPPRVSICKSVNEALEKNSDGVKLFCHIKEETSLILHTGITPEIPITVAVGPENGWSTREISTFKDRGFLGISLGPRVLRVDVAISSILAQISLVRDFRKV